MAEGYIYILFNRAFQNDHFKIGMTAKTSEERAREISAGTGVPRSFEVLYEQRVQDCERAERLLHQRLNRYRVSGNREFFALPLKTAIRELEAVADEVGRIEQDEPKPPPTPTERNERAFGEITVAPSKPRKGGERKPANSVVTFENHADYTDAPRRPVLYELRHRVLALDEKLMQGEQCTTSQRIRYKAPGGRIFLEVKVQRAAILLRLADGECPDPNGITTNIPNRFGWGQLKQQITVLSMADLDAAMPFIEAAYRAEVR